MLHPAPGARVDAPRVARNAPLHQLNAPQLHAHLALRFEAAGGRTRMVVDAQQPPWRALRAFPHANGSTLVHLHNVSGGVLSGDRLTLDIDLGAGSAAQVTTTSATRLYRHRPASADSEQHTNIRVGQDALLEYLPDALIPFARSRHHQHTRITLADGAKLFWWETVAPGRQAMGETFAFDSLRIQTEVRLAHPAAPARKSIARARQTSAELGRAPRPLHAHRQLLCLRHRSPRGAMARARNAARRIL